MKPTTASAESYLRDRPALTTRRRRLIWLLAPVLLAALCGVWASTDQFDRLECLSTDSRFRHRGPLTPDPRIVVVEIDAASRYALTQDDSVFNLRAHLDDAIDRLADAGALAVGVDVWLNGHGQPEIDARLADVIANATVVLAVVHAGGRKMRPADVFLAAQPEEGSITVQPDPDGVLRRIPKLPNLNWLADDLTTAHTIPFFPFVLAYMVLDEQAVQAGGNIPPTDLTHPDHAVVVGRTVRYGELVNFAAGPTGQFRTFNFADIVEGKADLGPVDGAVVLIGEARKLTDQFTMPLSQERVPGVYYHANVVDQILQDRPLTEWPGSRRGTAWLVAAVAMLAGWYFWNLREWWRRPGERMLLGLYLALGAALFAGGWWTVCHRAFEHRVVLPMVAPLAAIAVVGLSGLAGQLGVTLVGARRLAQRNRQIESLFGRSVSSQVLAAIKSDPDRIARTEVHQVSVLFCDIRGFTAVSTELTPEQVAGMLNEYFEAITSAVFANDGFVDKFVGDELMAVFGVPLDQPDHAVRAARSALGIKEHLAELNRLRAARGAQPLQCGIGIHCGPAAAGHIGTAARANYTVVGDTVNLAARIEELTTGGEILISEQVRSRLGDAFPCHPWRSVELRGSDQTHALHQLLVPELAPAKERG